MFFADKVFGPGCSTDNVYEDGVKTVALSALMGINGNIFYSLDRSKVFYHYVGYLTYFSPEKLLQQQYLHMDRLAAGKLIR